MAKRKKEKKIYKYECSLTGETYKLTQKAENPDELLSVSAWYEMNSDKEKLDSSGDPVDCNEAVTATAPVFKQLLQGRYFSSNGN